MSTFYNTKNVKTKVNHICSGCGALIPKGFKVQHTKGMLDGNWINDYLCQICEKFIDDSKNLDDGTYEYHTFLFDEIDYLYNVRLENINYYTNRISFEINNEIISIKINEFLRAHKLKEFSREFLENKLKGDD